MIPLLARKYIYRYLFLAIALPIVAKLLLMAGHRLERRNDSPTVTSKTLIKAGSIARRKVEKADSEKK